MNVKLINVTGEAEKLIAYCARVSSPHQDSEDIEKLLKYCFTHKHWSIFEQADMTVEIITSRAIAQQILRHRSFKFQEFSQRYAEVANFEKIKPRRQDTKNRQNSIDDLPEHAKEIFQARVDSMEKLGMMYYKELLELGIAKECARFLLPLNVQTRLYMKGDVRSWIHYLQVRDAAGVQLEHREIAQEIKKIFTQQFPIISKLL